MFILKKEGKMMKKINWSNLFRTIVALTLVMALLLCCGCGKKGDDPTEPEQTTNPNALGDGDGKLEAQDFVDGFTKIYGAALEVIGGKTATSMGSEMDITLKLGDDILSYVSSMMESNGLPSDVSWLQQIGIGMDVSYQDELMQTGMAVNLGDTTVVSMNLIMDMLSGGMYMGFPELNDQYIGTTMDMSMVTGSAMTQMEAYAGIVGVLPTDAELNTLLTRYLNIMLERLSDPTTSDENLSYRGISQKVTATTYTVRAAQLVEMAEAALTAAKTDAELEKMLDAVAKYVNEQGAKDAAANGYTWYDVDLHQELLNEIEPALESLAEAKEDVADGDYLTFSVYTSEEEQLGFEFVVFAEDEESTKIYSYSLTEGEDTAFVLDLMGQLRFEGTGTNNGKKANGTYTLTVAEMEIGTVEVKDFDMKALEKGELDGTVRLNLSNAFIEQAVGPNAFLTSATVLEIVLKTEGTAASVAYNLYSGSALIAGIFVSSKVVPAEKIQVPENYADASDTAQMQQWAANADLEKILQNLRKAGVPEELVEMLEANMGL